LLCWGCHHEVTAANACYGPDVEGLLDQQELVEDERFEKHRADLRECLDVEWGR
jgi:hypothetical protein